MTRTAVALLLSALAGVGCDATATRTVGPAPPWQPWQPDSGPAPALWPPHCDPGSNPIPEDRFNVSGGAQYSALHCSPDGLTCTSDVSFTPTTLTVHLDTREPPVNPDTFVFEGPQGDGGMAALFVDFDASRFSIDSLVGVPVRAQSLMKTLLDCVTPDTKLDPGGPLGVNLRVLRDANGAIIAANGESLLRPGGVADFGQELLPELNLRWVSTPAEDCLYRKEALEVTTVATGEKVLGHWERRAHVTIGGHGYLFLVTGYLFPLVGCGQEASWVLIRDGFLHPVRDGG